MQNAPSNRNRRLDGTEFPFVCFGCLPINKGSVCFGKSPFINTGAWMAQAVKLPKLVCFFCNFSFKQRKVMCFPKTLARVESTFFTDHLDKQKFILKNKCCSRDKKLARYSGQSIEPIFLLYYSFLTRSSPSCALPSNRKKYFFPSPITFPSSISDGRSARETMIR